MSDLKSIDTILTELVANLHGDNAEIAQQVNLIRQLKSGIDEQENAWRNVAYPKDDTTDDKLTCIYTELQFIKSYLFNVGNMVEYLFENDAYKVEQDDTTENDVKGIKVYDI